MGYLVIGAGLTGAVIARELAENGHHVTVYEAARKPGGMCRTLHWKDLMFDLGPHSFHTNDYSLWKYIGKFTDFRKYNHWAKAEVGGKLVDWPVNLNTYDALGLDVNFNVAMCEPRNFEEAAVQQLGRAMYFAIVQDYTHKFWGCDPKELDSDLAGRLNPRMNHDNRFFQDKFQGMPVGGWGALFEGLLDHPNIRVGLGRRISAVSETRPYRYRKIFYTGCPDLLMGGVLGPLPYRGVEFEVCITPIEKCLPAPAINHGSPDHPYIRETDSSYPYPMEVQKHTVIVRETPTDKRRHYPLQNQWARDRWWSYKNLCLRKHPNVVLCGRLGGYEYLNMDAAVRRAIDIVQEVTR